MVYIVNLFIVDNVKLLILKGFQKFAALHISSFSVGTTSD